MRREELLAETKNQYGKGPARSCRRKSRIPGIVYGEGLDAFGISIDAHDFLALTHKGSLETMLIDLKVGDKLIPSMVKEIQKDPVTNRPVHLDFWHMSLEKEIHTEVPIHFIGTCIGIKKGGILDFILREVEIQCKPLEIPEFIEVDVTEMDVGNTLHISDLKFPEGIKVLSEPTQAVVTVVLPKEEVVAPKPEEAAVAAEGAEAGAATAEGEAKTGSDDKEKSKSSD